VSKSENIICVHMYSGMVFNRERREGGITEVLGERLYFKKGREF